MRFIRRVIIANWKLFPKKHDNVNICCIYYVPIKPNCLHSFKNKLDFPGGSNSKESACNAGDLGLIPESGRCPGEGNGNPLQCSYLENSIDRGAWQTTDHGITKSGTQVKESAVTERLTLSKVNPVYKVKVKVTESGPTLRVSTVHGILQARIPRYRTQVSHIAGGFFTSWATQSPRILESWPRNWTGVSCIAGRFFYQLSYQGSPIYKETEHQQERQ